MKINFRGMLLFGITLIGFNLCIAQQAVQNNVSLHSPDKKLNVEFYQKEINKRERTLYYKVTYKDQPLINESVLDIQLDNRLSERAMALKEDKHEHWVEDLSIKAINKYSEDTTWTPVHGERASVRDNYNAAVIEMQKDDNPMYKMNVEIRAYNEGIAIRYFFPENEKGSYYRIVSENTEFVMPEGTMAYHTSWAQAPYQLLPLQNWPDESERPLTLKLANGTYACLLEAQMVDYSRTKFSLSKEKKNTIVTAMHDPADLISPFATPWRVIMAAERAGDLIENNDIILNLNAPSKIKDPSWLIPGKIIRIMDQTTDYALAYIDFAAKHNFQYVLIDWKWYGPPFTFDSDATEVVAPLDMPGIINYAKEKGIGVWLYVNQQALLAQSDSLFKVYQDWGVKGVKFGFVQTGSHRWTTWLEKAFQRAADHKLLVNVHDEWIPTGEQRTWPNLLTAEGIRGNEEMPDATHNTVLPFTRFLAGTADYTVSYYDARIKTTHAHQLALSAIYYSPLQTLLWYDKPEFYKGEPEIEFFEKIPTVWDETKVLHGEPGQYITTARRNGNDWFVGTITNNEARTLKVPLSFLPKGKRYIASIYADDPSISTATKVRVVRKKVTSSTVLDARLLPSGGQAIWLTSERD